LSVSFAITYYVTWTDTHRTCNYCW